MSEVQEITDETFEQEVLKSDLPAMIDLWAPWCGPCRMVSPIIEELAGENEGKIKTCKLNVEDHPETAGKYGVSAIPTILFFKDGQEVEGTRIVGARPKEDYQRTIDEVAG